MRGEGPLTWTNALGVRPFNVVLLGNLVAGGLTSPGVNKYEATLTACTCLGPCLYHTSKYTTLHTYPPLGVALACATERGWRWSYVRAWMVGPQSDRRPSLWGAIEFMELDASCPRHLWDSAIKLVLTIQQRHIVKCVSPCSVLKDVSKIVIFAWLHYLLHWNPHKKIVKSGN